MPPEHTAGGIARTSDGDAFGAFFG